MAEAAAALYTLETAVEGAALGAIAISKATAPLHVRFRKLHTPQNLPAPSSSLSSLQSPLTTAPTSTISKSTGRVGHSFDIVKGRGYIFGGDGVDTNSNMEVVTLPVSLQGVNNGDEVDVKVVGPQLERRRPLAPYTDVPSSTAATSGKIDTEGFEKLNISGGQRPDEVIPICAEHASTNIGPNIFILGGRKAQSGSAKGASPYTSTEKGPQLLPLDKIYCFSTQTQTWTILSTDSSKATGNIPPGRTGASASNTIHPQPVEGSTLSDYGTIFLHGGYDAQGKVLRDSWMFDVRSKTWTRLADIPDPAAEEIGGEGRIACTGTCLWRVGDGFGRMMYLDFDVIEGDVVDSTSGPYQGEIAIKQATTGWQVLIFDVRPPKDESVKEPTAKVDALPVPRKRAGFVPITTGAGREYLLYFMGEDGPDSYVGDCWSFQVPSTKNSLASVKDRIRNAIGRDSGEHQWAACDVVEHTKTEGVVEMPKGLTSFASDTWGDLGGGNVVLWGGKLPDGTITNEGWVLTAE